MAQSFALMPRRKLPREIGAPDPYRTVRLSCDRVPVLIPINADAEITQAPSGDLHDTGQPRHRCRRRSTRQAPVAELTGAVIAPRPDCPIGFQRKRVAPTCS